MLDVENMEDMKLPLLMASAGAVFGRWRPFLASRS